MESRCARAEVRRASVPYYRPFVVVDPDTNAVLAHCKTEAEAVREARRIRTAGEPAKPSGIQPSGDVIATQQTRMAHPFGEPKPDTSRRPDNPGRRTVKI